MPSDDDRSIETPEDLQRELDVLHSRLDAISDAIDRLDGAVERVEELEARVADLEETVDLVDATMPRQQRGKLEKIRHILAYATTEATGGQRGVKVTTPEATAAAGSSRDTARRLMDEIGATYPWASVENPGGPRPKALKLDVAGRDLSELMDDVREHVRGQADP